MCEILHLDVSKNIVVLVIVGAAGAATRFWSGARDARVAQKNSEAAYTICSELFSD